MEKIKEFRSLREESIRRGRDGIFHSIRLKVNLAVSVCGLVLLIFNIWLLSDSMNYVERDLTGDRLASDIRYLCSELPGGEDGTAAWSMRDGALYRGETLIGDGTPEAAASALSVAERCQAVTDTYFCLFVKADGEEGTYRRVCCTVKGANGADLTGSYMDPKIAKKLEKSKDGVYLAQANVGGIDVFCRYALLYDAEGNVVGVISDGRSTDSLNSVTGKQKLRGVILIAFAMLMISTGLGVIVYTMLGAIRKIRGRLDLIGEGEYPEEPLTINTKDELQDVAESINAMVESLKEKERIRAELSLATDIQAHMLPSIFPPFPEHDEFEIFATMDPAKEVGGDFYDFFMLDEKTLAFVIADVSGKGVPAALFMVIAKTLIKNHTQMGMAPADVFTKVNQMLCEGNDAGLFVTAWMGVLDVETGKLTYVNAGHNPPLILQDNGEYVYLKSRAGFVLAGMEGVRYRQNELTLKPGDRLFLYTDGVTEATNPEKELYGEKRLSEYLNSHKETEIEELLHGLREELDRFDGEAEQFDDITMLILHYQKRQASDGMKEREFPATTDALADVTAFVEEELEAMDCPLKTVMQINIAVEEIFVNIASYAYEGKEGTMKLGIRAEEDGSVLLRFADRGMPFDPLAKKDPDVTLSAEERDIGGLGIFMVKKTMDDVEYRYENGQNILKIRKKL